MTSDIDVKNQPLHSNEQERHGMWTWEGLISNHDDSPNDLKLTHLIVPVGRTFITYSSKITSSFAHFAHFSYCSLIRLHEQSGTCSSLAVQRSAKLSPSFVLAQCSADSSLFTADIGMLQRSRLLNYSLVPRP